MVSEGWLLTVVEGFKEGVPELDSEGCNEGISELAVTEGCNDGISLRGADTVGPCDCSRYGRFEYHQVLEMAVMVIFSRHKMSAEVRTLLCGYSQ